MNNQNRFINFVNKNVVLIAAIIITGFIIAYIKIDSNGGWAATHGVQMMTEQEVHLAKDEAATPWTINTVLVNISTQPVTFKSNFTRVALYILKVRPNETVSIGYTESEFNLVTNFSFIVSERDDRSILVNSNKPFRGTVAALYYIHYRYSLRYDILDAKIFAEREALIWEAAQKGLTFDEYVQTTGLLQPLVIDENTYNEVKSVLRGIPFVE
jgi:hypothetical protein